jgi:hypothetical protein
MSQVFSGRRTPAERGAQGWVPRNKRTFQRGEPDAIYVHKSLKLPHTLAVSLAAILRSLVRQLENG